MQARISPVGNRDRRTARASGCRPVADRAGRTRRWRADRPSAATVDAPKNNHGLSFRSKIEVSAENLGCGKSKKMLKKFVKVFNSNEQTSVMGFTCELPQRGNGEIFYRCRKGDATAKGHPEGQVPGAVSASRGAWGH